MDTWTKFQIDYIERQLGRKLKKRERELTAWFLKLSKKEQVEIIKLERIIITKRNETKHKCDGTPIKRKTLPIPKR